MLTAELVRAQVRKGELRPGWIDASSDRWLDVAGQLCALFAGAKGRRRSEIEEEVLDLCGDDRQHMVTRGLARLLEDRSEWNVAAEVDPVLVRRRLFELAAAHGPVRAVTRGEGTTRDELAAMVATELEVSVEVIEAAMFGDLKDEERLISHRPLEPAQLLHRYNVALVQSLLLRAQEVTIELGDARASRLRQLFRWLKFHQLMHRTTPAGPSRWKIVVDGPLSIFQSGQRYGLQLANFFPAILLTTGWSLEAQVPWGEDRTLLPLRVTPEDGLVTHLRNRGTWQSDEERVLIEKLQAASDWEVSLQADVLMLGGQDVVVPDLVLIHRATGRRTMVELVGYWRGDYLRRRRDLLLAHAPANLVLCVSRNLKTSDAAEDFEWPATWLEYASVISPSKLLSMALKVAV
jgi:hypothetical protein